MISGRSHVAVLLALGLLVLGAAGQADGAESTEEESAAQVASTWFSALMKGDTAVATALSDVPFALDSKRIVESLADLRRVYDQIVADKGRREIAPSEVAVGAAVGDRLEGVCAREEIPVLLMVEGEGVAICVRRDDGHRVVGFSD